jgi:hypothetical protein
VVSPCSSTCSVISASLTSCVYAIVVVLLYLQQELATIFYCCISLRLVNLPKWPFSLCKRVGRNVGGLNVLDRMICLSNVAFVWLTKPVST